MKQAAAKTTCVAEAEARRLAVAIIDLAIPEDSGVTAFRKAQAAADIIKAAEIEAAHVDQSAYMALLDELAEWADEAETHILDLLKGGATASAVEEEKRRHVAELDARERAVKLWLARQPEAAWKSACEKLRALADGTAGKVPQ